MIFSYLYTFLIFLASLLYNLRALASRRFREKRHFRLSLTFLFGYYSQKNKEDEKFHEIQSAAQA